MANFVNSTNKDDIDIIEENTKLENFLCICIIKEFSLMRGWGCCPDFELRWMVGKYFQRRISIENWIQDPTPMIVLTFLLVNFLVKLSEKRCKFGVCLRMSFFSIFPKCKLMTNTFLINPFTTSSNSCPLFFSFNVK